MSEPRVSVHIVTYNQEAYIAQAIEGALDQQTDFPIEIVIGEDCSTDGTRGIVLDYQRRHPEVIRVITSDRNVGARANSRRVFGACRGKYIAFCDGDDFWHHPLKLQRQVDCLEAQTDVGLVHSNFDACIDDREVTIKNCHRLSRCKRRNSEPDVFSGMLLGQYTVGTCTVCARRSLLLQVHERERDILSDPSVTMADLCWWLGLSRLGGFFYIDEALSTYRVRRESAANSMSRVDDARFVECSAKVRLHFARKYGCAEDTLRAVEKNYYRAVLTRAYHANDHHSAEGAFKKMVEAEGRVPLYLWLYLLGGTNRFIKWLILPLVLLRRVVLRLRRRLFLSRCASRSTCQKRLSNPVG